MRSSSGEVGSIRWQVLSMHKTWNGRRTEKVPTGCAVDMRFYTYLVRLASCTYQFTSVAAPLMFGGLWFATDYHLTCNAWGTDEQRKDNGCVTGVHRTKFMTSITTVHVKWVLYLLGLSHCHSCISWERTFINIMECHVRLHVQYQVALIQAQIDLLDANLNIYAHVQNRRRRRRRLWCRAWLGSDRRRQFGLYDQLMTELRREDQKSFVKFMRMQPEMFDEILERVGPRITKQYTFYRAPIDPGMKLAVTLRHLASGSKYTSMQFGWRVPHNTISVIVREVNRLIFYFPRWLLIL